MPGYVIADIDVHDPENYEEYKKTATPTATEFGGRYIVRGGKLEVLEGEWAAETIRDYRVSLRRTGQGMVEFAIVCRTEKDPSSHGEVELLCG